MANGLLVILQRDVAFRWSARTTLITVLIFRVKRHGAGLHAEDVPGK
jgi:hypothetical protein